jgi:hypothetical protein
MKKSPETLQSFFLYERKMVRIPVKWAADSGDVGQDSVLMWAAFFVSP